MKKTSKYIITIIIFLFAGMTLLSNGECFASDCTMKCSGMEGTNEAFLVGGVSHGNLANACCCSEKDACIASIPEINYTAGVSITNVSTLKLAVDVYDAFSSADRLTAVFHRPLDYNQAKPLVTNPLPIYLRNSTIIR